MKVNTHLSVQVWGAKESAKQILLIHGWGMSSSVWIDVAQYLEVAYADYLITAVDLPGYGESVSYTSEKLNKAYDSQSLAQSLQPLLEGKKTIVIAWSMGGLAAIELAAKQNTVISQLILVSSTPRFVQGNDWHNAVSSSIFESFYQDLLKDHQATLKRFLAIQAMGSTSARQDIKYLYAQLFNRGEPDAKALEQGLNMLLNEDKREQLQQIHNIPVSLICGDRDTLVNICSQQQLAEQSHISLYSISGAGHAPFISHQHEFKKIIARCLALS